ncbi:MAG: hypothetical protein R3F60_32330 [bacterium]
MAALDASGRAGGAAVPVVPAAWAAARAAPVVGGAGGIGGGAGDCRRHDGPDCVAVCTTLGRCAARHLPGHHRGQHRKAFVDGCETCGMQPALAALVNGDNAEGTIKHPQEHQRQQLPRGL